MSYCLAIRCQPRQLLLSSKLLWTFIFEANQLSWQNFKHICTDGAPAMIDVRSGFITMVKNVWPHVTSLFTTSIHFSIKDSISTFDESCGRCGQSDQLYSFESKNHSLFLLLAKEMGAQRVGLCFILKSVGCREANASFGCMNLKMKLKFFFEKTKPISMSNITMKSLL